MARWRRLQYPPQQVAFQTEPFEIYSNPHAARRHCLSQLGDCGKDRLLSGRDTRDGFPLGGGLGEPDSHIQAA